MMDNHLTRYSKKKLKYHRTSNQQRKREAKEARLIARELEEQRVEKLRQEKKLFYAKVDLPRHIQSFRG